MHFTTGISAILALAASARAAVAVPATTNFEKTPHPTTTGFVTGGGHPYNCAHDNCYRAAVGTAGTRYGQQIVDCSSFLRTTFVDYDITSTITSYSGGVTYEQPSRYTIVRTETPGDPAFPTRHTGAPSGTVITASSVPTYAAAQCSGASSLALNAASRYSSACACAGVRPVTTTVPGRTPTITAAATTVVDRPAVAPLPALPCGTKLKFDAVLNCDMTVVCNKAPGDGFLAANYGASDEFACAKMFAEHDELGAEAAFFEHDSGSCLLWYEVYNYVDSDASDALIPDKHFCS